MTGSGQAIGSRIRARMEFLNGTGSTVQAACSSSTTGPHSCRAISGDQVDAQFLELDSSDERQYQGVTVLTPATAPMTADSLLSGCQRAGQER